MEDAERRNEADGDVHAGHVHEAWRNAKDTEGPADDSTSPDRPRRRSPVGLTTC
jgi:hypothetical protein